MASLTPTRPVPPRPSETGESFATALGLALLWLIPGVVALLALVLG